MFPSQAILNVSEDIRTYFVFEIKMFTVVAVSGYLSSTKLLFKKKKRSFTVRMTFRRIFFLICFLQSIIYNVVLVSGVRQSDSVVCILKYS